MSDSDKPVILIADDEEDVRELVGMNLRRAGFATEEVADGLQALKRVKESKPDLIVLDVMMPGRDGLQVCEELRMVESTRLIPIIMLTAKGQTEDRISGLEHGADDYLPKPFSPKELVLRVQALLRRSGPVGDGTELKVGPFVFDLSAVKLTVSGEPMDLTLLEFKLLHLLANHEDEVVERDTILREVWGYSESVRTRTLDTHVKRLREKLGDYADWVQTSRGFGYIFKAPAAVSV
ncbi:response regulator transcription factor [Phragmitibacter flavus]|uniref:Response regulator transcription factor n=1 Tax=Phragmitibacter flavus TaxID=2576071 RepID=A0A5R8KEN6_9BACT|nr:response regulator transcription factor [Phragmitibacter flavus]TLD70059.1 response regulator transcription factor [Phragmitibacter flavus]